MLYIICALKSEAQAFVDKYKLPKNKINAQVTLIVSGIGSDKMFESTLLLASRVHFLKKLVQQIHFRYHLHPNNLNQRLYEPQ